MKAVEQLVIREKADTQGLIGKTFMNGLVDGGKRFVVSPILKNGPDTGCLLFYMRHLVSAGSILVRGLWK